MCLFQNVGFFCRSFFAKETYNCKEPTNRSHPIPSGKGRLFKRERGLRCIAQNSTHLRVCDPHKYLPEKKQANKPHQSVKDAYTKMKKALVVKRNTACAFGCALRTSICQKKSRHFIKKKRPLLRCRKQHALPSVQSTRVPARKRADLSSDMEQISHQEKSSPFIRKRACLSSEIAHIFHQNLSRACSLFEKSCVSSDKGQANEPYQSVKEAYLQKADLIFGNRSQFHQICEGRTTAPDIHITGSGSSLYIYIHRESSQYLPWSLSQLSI